MEDRINALIDYELYDDGKIRVISLGIAIILAEEMNHLERDEKWLLMIGKALFNKQLYYRSILCLNSCSSNESRYHFLF